MAKNGWTPPEDPAFDPPPEAAGQDWLTDLADPDLADPDLDAGRHLARELEPEPDAVDDGAYEVRDEIVLEKSIGGATFKLFGFDDGAAFEPPTWLIDGVLPARGVTMLFAPAGIGKTWVVDDWAVRIASGTPWLDRPVMPGSVVYIAAEGAFTLPLRTFAAKDNLGIHRNLPIFFVSRPLMFGSAGTHVEILAEMVKDHVRRKHWPPVALVVVDTYTESIEGSANDDDVASAFTRGLRQFLRHLAGAGTPAPAGLVIHHPGLKDPERGRGNSAFTGAVDCGMLLEELQPVPAAPAPVDPTAAPGPPATRTLVLHCAKQPRQGLPFPDIALSLQPTILTDEEARPLDVGYGPLTALVVQPVPGEVCRRSKKDQQAETRKMQERRALAALVDSEPLQSEDWRRKSEVPSRGNWDRLRDVLLSSGKVVQVEPLPGKNRYRYSLSPAGETRG